MAANKRQTVWIPGGNGKLMEFGSADLSSGTVAVETSLTTIFAAIVSFEGTAGGTANLVVNGGGGTAGYFNPSGSVEIISGNGSDDSTVYYIFIGH